MSKWMLQVRSSSCHGSRASLELKESLESPTAVIVSGRDDLRTSDSSSESLLQMVHHFSPNLRLHRWCCCSVLNQETKYFIIDCAYCSRPMTSFILSVKSQNQWCNASFCLAPCQMMLISETKTDQDSLVLSLSLVVGLYVAGWCQPPAPDALFTLRVR